MIKNEKQKIYCIKIIFLGESGVGKTSLENVYLDKIFSPNEMATCQPYETFKEVDMGNYIKLNISLWDTAGQEQYRSVSRSFIKGSNIVFFVYDVTRRETFLELNYWISAVNEELNTDEVILCIVANKIDLFLNSEVNKKEGEDYAKKKNALFCETSAKEDQKGFKNVVQKLLEKLLSTQAILDNFEEVKDLSFNLKEDEKKKQESKKCCG